MQWQALKMERPCLRSGNYTVGRQKNNSIGTGGYLRGRIICPATLRGFTC